MKKIYNILYREICLSKKGDVELRPNFSTVYHNRGRIVATDGFMAVTIPFEYLEELEGKMINRQGAEIEGRFPNVDSVFSDLKSTEKVEVDLVKLEEAVNNIAKLKFKDGKNTLFACVDILGDEGYCFSAPYLATSIKIFKELKKSFELRVSGRKYLLVLDSDYILEDDYAKCIIMPCNANDDTSETYFTLETALAYEHPKLQPKNKAWYE